MVYRNWPPARRAYGSESCWLLVAGYWLLVSTTRLLDQLQSKETFEKLIFESLRGASEPLAASEAWRDVVISFVLHKLEIASSRYERDSQ